MQKGKPITKDEIKSLKKKRLIEGRSPNLYVSAEVADATETRAEYIRKRAFDKDHYKKMVVDYLKTFVKVSRSDIEKLLMDKISDALDDNKKKNFITNLLQEMRREKTVQPVEGKRGKGSMWELYKSASKSLF